MSSSTMAEEWELVQAIVSGDTKAGDQFAERFRDSLVAWLCSKCDTPDGRSREQAVETVDNLLAECVAGDKEKDKPPLLTM